MAKSSRLRRSELVALMRLMVEVAGHRDQPAVQRQVLITGLGRLVHANGGFVSVCDGWKPGQTPRFLSTQLLPGSDDPFVRYVNDVLMPHTIAADPYCVHSIANSQPLIVMTQPAVLPTHADQDRFGPFAHWRDRMQLKDGVVIALRLDEARDGGLAGFALHRFGHEPAYTPAQKRLLRLAFRELQGMIRRGWFSLPEFMGDTHEQFGKLPPRLRQVLDLVLAGRHAKGIADDLDLSIHTVRDHLDRLYRHFGVSGRDELMARFVNAWWRRSDGR